MQAALEEQALRDEEYEGTGDISEHRVPRERESAEPITAVTDSRSEAIKEFAKENPEIVAQMVKSWLRSDND